MRSQKGKGSSRGKARDAEIGPTASAQIVSEKVRRCLAFTVRAISPVSDISKLSVHPMGSRCYGLHARDSDLDLYALAPVEVYMNSLLQSSLISLLCTNKFYVGVNASFTNALKNKLAISQF